MRQTKNYKVLSALKRVIVQADYKTVLKKFVDQGHSETVVQQYLLAFKELRDKKDLGAFKDIDLWGKKPFEEFQDFVRKTMSQKSKTEEKKLEKSEGAELVHQNKDWSVYKILNHKAARQYGAGTRWCITEEDGTRWREYTKNSVFYFLISKNRSENSPYYKIAVQVNKHGSLNNKFWDATDDAWSADQLLHNGILLEVFKDKEEMNEVLVPFEMPKPDWLREIKEKGLTDSVKDEIVDMLGEAPIKFLPDDNFLVVDEYKNVRDFVEHSGNYRNLKWLYRIIDGDDLMDVDIQGMSIDDIAYVLEKLNSKYPKEYEDFVSKLLKSSSFSEYLDDNEEIKIKTIEEFNDAKLKPNLVTDFISSGDDQDVWNVFEFSFHDASRSATEGKLHKMLDKQLMDCPVLLVTTGISTDNKKYVLADSPVYSGCYLLDVDSITDFREYEDEELGKLGIDSFDYEYPDTDEILYHLREYRLPEYIGS